MFNKKPVVTKDNFKKHLGYISDYPSELHHSQLHALTEEQRWFLLRTIISFLENIHSYSSHRIKAFVFDVFDQLGKKSEKIIRQREIDDAVAAALAKRDKEKPPPVEPLPLKLSDGAEETTPRMIADIDLRSVGLGRDGKLGICGPVRYVDMAEVIKPNHLFSGAVSAMLRSFITPSVPRDATIEQCRW